MSDLVWRKVNNDGNPAGADGGNMTGEEKARYDADMNYLFGHDHNAETRL